MSNIAGTIKSIRDIFRKDPGLKKRNPEPKIDPRQSGSYRATAQSLAASGI